MLVQSKLLMGAVAGMMGLAVAGSPALVGKHEGRLANTPLGRMVTGNFGRLMVLRS